MQAQGRVEAAVNRVLDQTGPLTVAHWNHIEGNAQEGVPLLGPGLHAGTQYHRIRWEEDRLAFLILSLYALRRNGQAAGLGVGSDALSAGPSAAAHGAGS